MTTCVCSPAHATITLVHRLSKREAEILQLALQGLTDKETASRLQISSGSVKTYWDRMRTKYEATSRLEIVGKLFMTHLNADILSVLEERIREGFEEEEAPTSRP